MDGTGRMRVLWMLAALAGACSSEPVDLGSDEDVASDSMDTARITASFVTLGTEPALGLANVAAAVANASLPATVGHYLSPAGCVTVGDSSLDTVHYSLDNCTGPYGLLHATGTVTVVFHAVSPTTVDALVTSDLTVSGATMVVNARAVVTGPEGARTAAVTTTSRAVGQRGQEVNHSGSYSLGWNAMAECLSLSGSFTTRVGVASWATTVTGYRKCDGRCPESGSIRVRAAAGRTTTLTYDGTSTARWSTAAGRTGTLSLLFCS